MVPTLPVTNLAMLCEHLQAQLMPRAIANFLGNARLLSSLFILRPILGKKQTRIDQGMLLGRHISHVDGHLAVIDFAEPTAPLAPDADRFRSRFWKSRGIENDHPILIAQLLAHLAYQLVTQGSVIPTRFANKPLQRHALLSKTIGNRLDILVLEVRKQALNESACMLVLFLADQAFNKRSMNRSSRGITRSKICGATVHSSSNSLLRVSYFASMRQLLP